MFPQYGVRSCCFSLWLMSLNICLSLLDVNKEFTMITQKEVQEVVVTEDKGQVALSTKLGNQLAVATATAMPLVAFAAEVPAAPDVANVVTYIGYAVAAITAIGVAKMIPAAAMWLYSSLTGMVKRG